MKLKILFSILAVLAALILIFRSQLYDFFVSPDGLSIAPTEICLCNDSKKELVAELDTFVGAKIETLLFIGECVCAPSPNKEVVGLIKVGLVDAGEYSCELKRTNASEAVLINIDDAGKCQWGK